MMPIKRGRVCEAGIRLRIERVEGETPETYRDRMHGAVQSVMGPAKERLMDIFLTVLTSTKEGKTRTFDCYAIAKQSQDAGMHEVPSYRRDFWNHALFATDSQWFQDRGFIVSQNSEEFFFCGKCGISVSPTADKCFQCGRFEDTVFDGQCNGVPLKELGKG